MDIERGLKVCVVSITEPRYPFRTIAHLCCLFDVLRLDVECGRETKRGVLPHGDGVDNWRL